MTWLARAGYHTVTMVQYLTWLGDGRTKLPVRPVLITADNGIFGSSTGRRRSWHATVSPRPPPW